jgi:putative SOS response-associated peptidase YedK
MKRKSEYEVTGTRGQSVAYDPVMCGRFSQGETSERIATYFGAYPDLDLPEPMFNVPPTEAVRIVLEQDGTRRLVAATWNFRPFWTDDTRRRAQPWINARSETALDSPAFGPALRSARCIVPADAFYEWDRSVSPRQPYAIGPAREGTLLALAGIWARSPEGGPSRTSSAPSRMR